MEHSIHCNKISFLYQNKLELYQQPGSLRPTQLHQPTLLFLERIKVTDMMG